MRVDLHGVDPWASRLPRRRDWLAAVLGTLLLAAGGIAVWQSVESSGAVAGPDTVDAAAWQTTLDRSQRLNRVMADLSNPWSRWLERSLTLAGPDIRLERFDGVPVDHRLELVVSAASLDLAGRFADALAVLPQAAGVQITRHDTTADGVRVHIEVALR